MSGLSILFRRREQYVKKVAKVDIIIYNSLKLKNGAQILMDNVFFRDNIIESRFAYGGTHAPALYGTDIIESKNYVLAKTNNGSYKGADNGAGKLPQYFLSGYDLIHKWALDGVYVGGTIRVTQARVYREWALKFLCNESVPTTVYYMNVYDSSGENLLHSIKPALLNKEIPGLWDEVERRFYGLTSDVGELELN